MIGHWHSQGVRGRRGFSLLELLASVTIISVLAVLGTGACQTALKKAGMTREIAAAKSLITAYMVNAADNDGRYLPGMDKTVNSIWFEPQKRDLSIIHLANRYPFRLAAYFDYNLNGTILVNNNSRQIEKMAPTGNVMHEYVISTYPAFGINYWFVGGCVSKDPQGNAVVSYPDDCVTKMGQGDSLLVFASGGSALGGRVDGYNILTPPKLEADKWISAPWKAETDPGSYGNVDARYDGKAVCAFLDGSVQMRSIEELRDMRLWNRKAREANDPNYSITY